MKRIISLAALIAVTLSLFLVPTAAQAATASLTLTTYNEQPEWNTPMDLVGTIPSGKILRNEVKVQSKENGTWVTIGMVFASNRQFSLTINTPHVNSALYRAVAKDARTGKSVRSGLVQIYPQQPAYEELNPDEVVQYILERTNEYRAQHNMPPLQIHPDIQTIAQNWAEKMAEEERMYHNPTYAGQYPQGWQGAAENVAYYFDYREVVDAWYTSDAHRTNMVGDYNYIGIGFAVDAKGYPYYVQNFAKY